MVLPMNCMSSVSSFENVVFCLLSISLSILRAPSISAILNDLEKYDTLFFTDGGVSDGVHEHQGAASVANVMIRLYCALVVAQGWIILHLTDATALVKKTVIQSYFGCFAASLFALIIAHWSNDGSLSGGFFGIVKFLAFLALTCGYGWFALFQPPEVFNVLGNSL